MIVIVDYGMGNLASIQNMVKKVGGTARISSDVNEIQSASKLILPGVGAFDTGMTNLKERGLIPTLETKAKGGTPVLGICLGMQLLSRRSEEGVLPGLGWIDAETIRFRFSAEQASLRIPHMGWNTVRSTTNAGLFDNLGSEPRFYFVHSYHVVCRDPADVLSTTEYGLLFTSALQNGNIMGVQFHPEKSHKFGMALFKNFLALPC
jgi:glutamine amidotransferase